MILYFLRHGLAGDREDWQEDDSLRPLTEKGKTKMAREAKAISDLDLGLDLILTSPLVRALQTAQIVAKRLKMKDRLEQDERLSPGFDLARLAAILESHPGAEAMLLVGHEPDFSETLSALTGGSRIVFKKGGLARADLSETNPPRGDLIWLLPPGELAR
ncbi:MAG TPA: phosphohistidine phosphatase SixA [Anaerolineales bacterium]